MPESGPLRLRTAISRLDHHAALLDGRVTIPGIQLEPAGGPDYAAVFREMCRDLAYDVAELSVMSYYAARHYGLPITAIPVVPRHQFHHRDFLINLSAGISDPADLAGKRVGTRTYTVTPGVLDRGILSDEFGVDTDGVTWVLAEPEHVAECEQHYPANVVPGKGEDLFPRLAAGDLQAGIAGANLKRASSPAVGPLFSDPEALDLAQYRRTGIVPAFTLIAVRDEVLDGREWLLEALYGAFLAAREYGLQPDPGVARIVPGDPVPFGMDANRASFEELLRLGREQHILGPQPDERLTIAHLFPGFG